jgi:hypothetical protein
MNARTASLPLILLAFFVAPLAASTLDVQKGNVSSGTHAAQVEVASSCTANLHEVVTGNPAGGAFVGCSSLTSDANLTGATTFTAGDLVILQEGFKVANGASLAIEIERSLYPDAWVQDDTPDGEKVYAARFYNDSTDLALTAAHEFYHFIAFDAAANPEVRVGVKFDDSLDELRLFLEVFLDHGGIASTETTHEIELPAGWHYVEVGWTASTGGNNGSAYLCVDEDEPSGVCENLSNLDNDTGAIDFVRWGAIDVPSNTPTGIGDIELDDFESRRSLKIGPLP